MPLDSTASKEAASSAPVSFPLVVDLDGTLVRTDTLHESLLLLLKQNPLFFLLLPFWLLRGKAHLKAQVARRVQLDPAHLPYCAELVELLHHEKQRGRPLVLATAADSRIASAVAAHLGLFSAVYASDGSTNLSGPRKLAKLQAALAGPFDYAGNAPDDVPVWRAARAALVVHAPASVVRQAQAVTTVERVFPGPPRRLAPLLRALRVHQWAKNALLFVPMLAAHRALELSVLLPALVAFAAFCLCASSVYVTNDLLDLPADRRHPSKRRRPFAAGDLSPRTGMLLAPVLLGAGLAAAWSLPSSFLLLLAGYLATTLAYSLVLKQVAILDVLVLAALYTARIFAGTLATGVPTSSWLFTFSMFLFLSLALVKRFSELRRLAGLDDTAAPGRGYVASDATLLGNLGTASGYLAVLVLALYLTGRDVTALYLHPERLWLLCPLLLYWISRVWMLAHRDVIDDDPLVFALRDRVSWTVAGLAALLLFLATRT